MLRYLAVFVMVAPMVAIVVGGAEGAIMAVAVVTGVGRVAVAEDAVAGAVVAAVVAVVVVVVAAEEVVADDAEYRLVLVA